ncbi:MAG: redoxin domain-containing protein [Flavobacteriaceae bacterium]|nr:redoxin domain-containing protein [Flavobacteriaceae bacterium]
MKNLIVATFIVLSNLLVAQNTIPKTPIKTLSGDITNLEKISEDNDLIIVSLWATWCVPCKNELDAISEVYNDWRDETNVVLYAISVDDSRTVKRVKPLINGKDWDYEVLLDTNNDLKRALGASAIPLTLIIKNGEIVYRHSGYVPGSEDDLFEELKKHS